jgi:glycosyltransferase involved in cell wall biosynthesis
MDMKRIIYSSDIDLSQPNGPGVNEREFVESLTKIFDKNITLIIPRFKNPMSELKKLFQINGNQLIFIQKKTKNPFLFLIKQINTFFILRTVFKNENYKNDTIFVFRLIIFPISQYLFIKIYNPQYVLRICGDGTFPFLNKNLIFKFIFKPLNKYIMRYLYLNSLCCDAVSNVHVKSLENNFQGNFVKIDNGVNTDRFIPKGKNSVILKNFGFSESDFIIGYTGNFPHIRGGNEIVEAFYYLKKSCNLKFKAIITGDDGGVKFLRKKILKYNLEDDIKLLGKIDYSKIPSLVNQLDLGVSFLDIQFRGASEQKVRQYLASGVPAIVSPGGSDFVDKHSIGRVVEHLDGIENVANVFLQFYEMDIEERMLYKLKARKFAEDYISVNEQNKLRLKLWEKNLLNAK